MNRVSSHLLIAALLLLFVTLGNMGWLGYAIYQVRHDALAVNASGQLRGMIQRLVKLTTQGQSDEENLVREITLRIHAMMEWNWHSAVFEEPPARTSMQALEEEWHLLREDVVALRAHPEDQERRQRMMARSETCWRLSDQMVQEIQFKAESKQNYFWVALFLVGSNVLAIIGIIWMIRRYVHGQLERLAHHDPLTGAYNRFTFRVFFEQSRKEALRYQASLTLILLDIDHFKQVNDTHGHPVGDLVLSTLAQRIRGELRASDALFRLGGEEFGVLANRTDLAGALILAEKLRGVIADPPMPQAGKVTISLGVAEMGLEEGIDPLYQRADAALYRAKQGGRNRVELADPPPPGVV